MKITHFENIEAWQEARRLVKLVYDVINTSEKFWKDSRLVNQLQGAAVSAMSNIAEGFPRKTNKEFIQYLFISKSSVAEIQSHLYVALDQKYLWGYPLDSTGHYMLWFLGFGPLACLTSAEYCIGSIATACWCQIFREIAGVAKVTCFAPYWPLFSKSSRRVKEITDQITPTDITILIKGEGGRRKTSSIQLL